MSKEKDERINVFVRVKPTSETDTAKKCAATVIDVSSDKEIIVYQRSQDRISKRFTFDRVFGPSSSQVDIYNTVVSPLLKQVIAGYNCTVFAYGQTGTGKTYTMEGDRVDDLNLHWQSSTSAGMIPRCFSQLFEELKLLENQRYTVRVNFLELYNEELFDLLTSDSNGTSKIKLYEDVTRKGSVIIHGLEEITVHDKTEIYKILEKGSERRQVAATLLNANSSRSHIVFSITIHMKENTNNGEELLKTAKLNLVDLAGNESVGKYGILDKKAREAKSINQSLLTLGRVITALVEKAPHVPYRESKLTRLLQDSLGGQTKTSIIATISSASGNFEETLSTLDYACRAKNITNYPKINEVLCRKAMLKEYTKEIERLKRDLVATREKNGINLSLDSYDAMKTLIDRQRVEIKEKKDYCTALEKMMQNKEEIFRDLQSQCDTKMYMLVESTSELEKMNCLLRSTKHALQRTEDHMNEHKYLVERYVETEEILHGQAEILLNVVSEASEDAWKLHDEFDYEKKMEEENEKLRLQIKTDFIGQCKNIEDEISVNKEKIHSFLQSIKDEIETYVTTQLEGIATMIRSSMLSTLYQHLVASKKCKKIVNTSHTQYQEALKAHASITMGQINEENKLLSDIHAELMPDISETLSRYSETLVQNLQILNENISQKLEKASTYAKLAIETICRNRLEEYNHFRNSLNEISKQIDHMSRNEKQIIENYKKFGKKMEDLSHEFNFLNNCESNYSETINKACQIDKICSEICDQTLQNYDADVNKQKDLKNFFSITQNDIKNNIDDRINQAQVLNKIITEKGVIFVNDLQRHLTTGCATLKRNNNNVQFNGKQLQQKMIKNKNAMLTSNANISKTIEHMGFPCVRFLEQRQDKILDFSKHIEDKFMTQNIELSNWNNNIIDKLHASQQHINKFSMENFCRDASTDIITPKKNFSYPRKFATTSPPEQLIQRFREVKKHMNEMEEDLAQ